MSNWYNKIYEVLDICRNHADHYTTDALVKDPLDLFMFSASRLDDLRYMQFTYVLESSRWFSGRMLACHAGGPGSIPGRCKYFFAFKP
ncbi:hypothetical protein L596_027206 [Steinernema carpocapsae]|uniref:Uncharacterized protein n=1 Tax=Steinernema carpocapsae TaxID=34508 RepID=A0A4U5M3M8_STECR|nr:hypothetical protein L596_027206 [Steinernema carpocapsae]